MVEGVFCSPPPEQFDKSKFEKSNTLMMRSAFDRRSHLRGSAILLQVLPAKKDRESSDFPNVSLSFSYKNAEGNSYTEGAIHGISQFMPDRAIHRRFV